MQHVLQFIHVAEQLKKEMRHSWLSNGRQESVAEHTWRLTVIAMALEPYLKQPLRMEKLLKMLIIHDLVEVYAGDIPAFEKSNRKEQKHANEQRAIERLQQLLGGVAGQELYDLWQEFESRETYEAKVANAIDKLEVQIQHNEASLDTWLPIEHEMTFQIAKHTEFDDALEQLRLLVVDEAAAKLEAGNIDISNWIKKV
ncbi:HD domain-containing protein [Caryophanon tenue]|uniref:HAD family hydrolase n=1 Tax=Caryophanon tenue TaxID=33978 RepID=A0A1C0YDI3_9BACL|nr:HD domain-containing protein [Caryophanon tenue]OCS85211.1 HAD family hydrolase [Caryophanon tenue]